MLPKITILPNLIEKKSQIARCPISLLQQLGAHVGSYGKLTSKAISVICLLLPRIDTSDDYLDIDDSVVMDTQSGIPFLSLGALLTDIKILTPIKLVSVQVTIVVSNLRDNVAKLKKSTQFQTLIKRIVLLYKIVSKSVINLLDTPFNKVCNIAFIKILNVGMEGDVIGQVTGHTSLEIIDILSQEKYFQLQQHIPKALGGMDNIIVMLKKLLTRPFTYAKTLAAVGLSRPKGILLIGPPGSGKTSLVREVCRQCDAYLITVIGTEIFRPYPGESESLLKQIFTNAVLASKEGPTVFFIDEIDTICPKRSDAGGNHQRRLVACLLTLMDGIEHRGNLIIIGATNHPTALDPAIRRAGRFDKEIFLNVPTSHQRLDILQNMCSTLSLSAEVDLHKLAAITIGYVGADLALLCQEAESKSVGEICMKDFEKACQNIKPTPQRGSLAAVTELRPISWTSIGGLESVIEILKQSVELPLLYPDKFCKLGLKFSQGILLYGPPGCCKTTLVRALATSIKVPVFAFTGAQIFSPFVGDSEKMISEIFRKARLTSPCILFFDEFESLVGKRDHADRHNTQHKVLATFLNEMDGIGLKLEDIPGVMEEHGENTSMKMTNNQGVFIVGATNKPELIDSALLRPGRFDKIIFVPPPDYEARINILKTCTEGFQLEDVNFNLIAEKTELFSGADLKKVFYQAAVDALVDENHEDCIMKQKHFETALNHVKSSLTLNQLDHYKAWAQNTR